MDFGERARSGYLGERAVIILQRRLMPLLPNRGWRESAHPLRASGDSLSLSPSISPSSLSLSLYAQAAGCIGYDVGNIVGFLALMHVQRLPPRARVHGSGLTIGDRSVCEREREREESCYR